ncbi:MAG: hypothetical protein JXA33_29025 [Anaerolineae bacterium]|nr:hypothetical protein [Anaerolineae bacterium]
MLKKVWMYSIVGVLALALIGGTIYIVLRSSNLQAARGWASTEVESQTTGYRGGEGDIEARGAGERLTDGRGTGYGQQQVITEDARGRGNAGSTATQDTTGTGQGRRQTSVETLNGGGAIVRGQGTGNVGQGITGAGQGVNMPEAILAENWETVEGTVTVSGSELTVQTENGEVLVGMGQSWYCEEAGFVVEVGDKVRVYGYEEDNEFKAGTVENLTTGQTITLRDSGGRPMWAGRGNLKNRSR